MKLSIKIQIGLGIIIIIGLIAMSAGVQVVPKDPDTKALFNRIIDAIFIILNVPMISEKINGKESKDEEIVTTYPPAS